MQVQFRCSFLFPQGLFPGAFQLVRLKEWRRKQVLGLKESQSSYQQDITLFIIIIMLTVKQSWKD